jgi:hypothetical protein
MKLQIQLQFQNMSTCQPTSTALDPPHSAPGSSDAETKTATPAATGRQSPSRWGDRTNLDGFHLNAWTGCVHIPYFWTNMGWTWGPLKLYQARVEFRWSKHAGPQSLRRFCGVVHPILILFVSLRYPMTWRAPDTGITEETRSWVCKCL